MTWSSADVLHEAQEWAWAPPGTKHLQTDWFHALRRPETKQLSVLWVDLHAEPDEICARLSELAQAEGCHELSLTVSDAQTSNGLEDYVVNRGAQLEITHQIMGLDLTADSAGVTIPEGIEVEVVNSPDVWLESTIVAQEVWGAEQPTKEDLASRESEFSRSIPDRGGFSVLARRNREPAASAGVTLAGRVARMWGAGTRPAHRGHGAYQATVAKRLTVAAEHGATLGLTNAIADTSAPILTRLGFTRYGTTRTYVCTIAQ